MRFLVLAFLLVGCITRQEFREQHCAQLAIARHGYKLPIGAYGTWMHGDRCFCRLWNGHIVFEGKLDDRWRPE